MMKKVNRRTLRISNPLPILLISLLVFSFKAYAIADSTLNKISYSASINIGKIIPHHTILTPLKEGKTYGVEIYLRKPLKLHDRAIKYYGLTLDAYKYGNANLGYSISAIPTVTAKLFGTSRIGILLSAGTGIGFASKTYHPVNNPSNLSISAPLNIAAKVELELSFPFQKENDVFVTIVANHMSNGNIKKPNYGVNALSVAAGVRFGAHYYSTKGYYDSRYLLPREKLNLLIAGGYREAGDYGGKKYAVGSIKISYSALKWENNSLSVGTDLMFDKASLFHLERSGIDHSGNRDALKLGLNIGVEKYLYKVSIMATCGLYVYRKDKTGGNVYQNITLGYWLTPKLGSFVSLKTHWTTADYLELGLRVRV